MSTHDLRTEVHRVTQDFINSRSELCDNATERETQRAQREGIQDLPGLMGGLISQFPDKLKEKDQLLAVCRSATIYQKGRNAGAERDNALGNFASFIKRLGDILGIPFQMPPSREHNGTYGASFGGLSAVAHGQNSLTDYLDEHPQIKEVCKALYDAY
mmetsp:Transcript_25322/g.71017  ORF Transcript_25322/g.71017 Transcript_25322/m.71017 type:complete len:158 (+) Transcript_25322:221-694(+)